jgi:mono/diheme cytochrome c family protein
MRNMACSVCLSLIWMVSTAQAADPVPQGSNHRENFEKEVLHFTHQGSGFFPMQVVRALNDKDTHKPFLENLERFGLVPGEKSNRNSEGFPVGIVTNTITSADHIKIEMFGFTCAACHTSDLRYKDQVVRVDGASGLFSVDLLGDQIGNSLEATLKDPEEFFAFLLRYRKLSKPDSVLLAKFEKLVDLKKDSELGEALSAHLHEVAQHLLADIQKVEKSAEAGSKSLVGKAENLLKKKRIGGRVFHNLAEEVLKREFGDIDGVISDIKYRLDFLKSRAWLQKPGNREPAGFGRADDFGTARVELFGGWNAKNLLPVNAPVSVPPLWDIDRFAWLHWNSNTNSVIQRSIGESIGVGATFQTKPAPTTSVDVVNQMHIEEQIQKLTSPDWPEQFGKPNSDKVARGKLLYGAHCAKCHDPTEEDAEGLLLFHLSTVQEAGTDPNDSNNFDRPVFKPDGSQVGFAESIASLLQELQDATRKTMSPEDVALMDRLEAKRKPKWRDTATATGGPVFPARPLDGVWATAPYLHNGSVPTLWHLLLPEDQRPKKFLVGLQDFDPQHVGFEWDPVKYPSKTDPHNSAKQLFELDTTRSGNSNRGHNYGTTLTDGERGDLIEYLKVHRTPSLRPRTVGWTPVDAETTPAWDDLQRQQDERQARYLQEQADGYDWFANAGDGYGGLPVILLRSLPDLAPEIWGAPEENFPDSACSPVRPKPIDRSRWGCPGIRWFRERTRLHFVLPG